ncbi:MAG: hypothetical protein SOW29_01820 [Candidatus Faecousia sp.]|nr:hypothetical protein [Candidatus Faecousia sp.]
MQKERSTALGFPTVRSLFILDPHPFSQKLPAHFITSSQKNQLPIQKRGCFRSLFQTVKIASQSSLRQQRKESESFSAGACTWQKIQLRLQVWNLFAYGEQIMRAADCKNWRKSPKGFFDKLKEAAESSLFA